MQAVNKKKILKGICFIVIFLILFFFFQKLLQAKWIASSSENSASTSAWIEYRSLEENSLDVLFLGTSHSYFAVDPMYVYDKTGVTSYVFGGPGLRMDLTYMNLEDALKTQTPSVVFLDMSAIQFDFQQQEAKCHKVLDQLPMTWSKIEYAFNTDSEEMKPLDVLFPFFRYHSRWSDLSKKDFKYILNDLDETYIRGHYVTYQSKVTEYHFYEDVDYVLTDRNLDYIKRMKKLCDEKGIELVLYKIPTPTWYESQSKGAKEIAQMLGLDFLELFYEVDEIGLDVEKDFRDKNNHLNQRGAEKLSGYLAEYIQDHYQLKDQRGENTRWNEDLAKYKKMVKAKREKADKK